MVSWCLSFRVLYAPGLPGAPDLGPAVLHGSEYHFLRPTKSRFVQRYDPKREGRSYKRKPRLCKSLYFIHTGECCFNNREE